MSWGAGPLLAPPSLRPCKQQEAAKHVVEQLFGQQLQWQQREKCEAITEIWESSRGIPPPSLLWTIVFTLSNKIGCFLDLDDCRAKLSC
jgi:hypothetical protein